MLDNIVDHLKGNVLVKFKTEDDAENCKKNITGRLYAGRLVVPEYSPITDFSEGRCRQFDTDSCKRGSHCNYMHIKAINKDLLVACFKQMYKENPQYKQRRKDQKDGKDRKDKDRKVRRRSSDSNHASSRPGEKRNANEDSNQEVAQKPMTSKEFAEYLESRKENKREQESERKKTSQLEDEPHGITSEQALERREKAPSNHEIDTEPKIENRKSQQSDREVHDSRDRAHRERSHRDDDHRRSNHRSDYEPRKNDYSHRDSSKPSKHESRDRDYERRRERRHHDERRHEELPPRPRNGKDYEFKREEGQHGYKQAAKPQEPSSFQNNAGPSEDFVRRKFSDEIKDDR